MHEAHFTGWAEVRVMSDIPPVLVYFLLHSFSCGLFCPLHLRDTITSPLCRHISLFKNLLKVNPARLALLICRLKVPGLLSVAKEGIVLAEV